MELAMQFNRSQPAVSRHLKVLEGAGLIVRRAGGRRHCRLAKTGLDSIGPWLAGLERRWR